MIPTMGVMVLGGMGDWEETPEEQHRAPGQKSQGVQQGDQQGGQGAQGDGVEEGDIMTFKQRRKRRKMNAEKEGVQESGTNSSQGVPRSPSRRAKTVSLGMVSGARNQNEQMNGRVQAEGSGKTKRKRN